MKLFGLLWGLPDDAALVAFVAAHVEVAGVGDGEHVGGQLAKPAAVVQPHLVSSVQRQLLIRVHRHQNRACVGLPKTDQR